MSKRKEEINLSSLGDTEFPIPTGSKKLQKELKKVNSTEIKAIQVEVLRRLKECKTHREMLELQVNSLSECVGVATAIWQGTPTLDNSYQLSALTNAHRAALAQLEKMKDPVEILSGVENHIRSMFLEIVKAMALEMDKTKREVMNLLPEEKPTVDDLFDRMTNSIQPETQNIYNDLRMSLKKILGIRGS